MGRFGTQSVSFPPCQHQDPFRWWSQYIIQNWIWWASVECPLLSNFRIWQHIDNNGEIKSQIHHRWAIGKGAWLPGLGSVFLQYVLRLPKYSMILNNLDLMTGIWWNSVTTSWVILSFQHLLYIRHIELEPASSGYLTLWREPWDTHLILI